MIEIDIPGGSTLRLAHLVLDFNGTLAEDGEVLGGVIERLERLVDMLDVHVLTADTHGTVAKKLKGFSFRFHIIGPHKQDEEKLAYIQSLNPNEVMAVGNGRVDVLMLQAAALGVAVILKEGACSATVLASDVVCTDILDALDLLLKVPRLQATLRN